MKKAIDTSQAHTGRVYDYLLGGTQNFEADRQAADSILKLSPSIRTQAQLNRWFLQYVANRWAEEGHTRILDLASGLPTQGHFNEHLPNARILFSDHDPLSVQYGEEILQDVPSMRYVFADLRDPTELLTTANTFFAGDRNLAIGVIGISYFLTDEELHRLAKMLHGFAAPGSVLALSYFVRLDGNALIDDLFQTYMRMVKAKLHFRTQTEIAELLRPWRIVEEAPVADLLNVQHLVKNGDSILMALKATGVFAVHS